MTLPRSRWPVGRWLLLLAGLMLAGPSRAAGHGDVLMVMPVEGGQPTQLVAEPERRCGSPRWSPDGEWIAYDTAPYDDRVRRDMCRVKVVRADGTERREIAPGGMPTWSPDGTQLAWHTYVGSGPVQVGRLDGTAVETVIDHWGNPVWLRDGSGIVTIDRGGLSRYDFVSGSEETILATPSYVQYGYSVSPRSDRTSFRTQRYESVPLGNGREEVFTDPSMVKLVVASFDQAVEPIDRVTEGEVEYSSWSPDGERLVISWKEPGASRFQLYTLTADGNDEPKRVPGQGRDRSNLQPDWSPDGESLVFRRYVDPGATEGGEIEGWEDGLE